MLGNPLLLGDDGYQISRSVRLRSSASANFSKSAVSTSTNTLWTYSIWVKRGSLGATMELLSAASGATSYSAFFFNGTDNLVYQERSGATNYTNLNTTQVFRDPSAWYHIVLAYDSANATAANRVRIFVNGAQVTSFSTATYPSTIQNSYIAWSGATLGEFIGRFGGSATEYLDGYITEVNFVTGQALTPASFGETNPVTGVWQPKKYTGTYGTNGFYLNFSDPSAATAAAIGKDYSGNGNNWTPNNISVTAGATYDSMLDVPTPWADGGNGRGNYCTLNPLNAAMVPTAANLNLEPSGTGGNYPAASTVGVSSGKWYFEIVATNYTGSGQAGEFGFRLASASAATVGTSVGDANGFSFGMALATTWYSQKYNGAVTQLTGLSNATTGTLGMVAVDFDAGNAWVGKDGVWYNSGNPATGANPTITGITAGTYVATIAAYRDATRNYSFAANFGQRPFAYTPPSGFKALNTFNLPDATIPNGSKNFGVSLYTGTNLAQSVTNSGGFQPDFVWLKGRSVAYNHYLYDSVRGALKELYSDSTSAEFTATQTMTSFNSSGFSVGTNNGVNQNAATYVGWQWRAGGAAVTNTSGSISSQVSANPTAGFSVVTATTPASGAFTVGHGLGVAPRMIIVKDRANATGWPVWHASVTTQNEYLLLNTTAAKATLSGMFGAALPTSTVFGQTVGAGVNANAGVVAYCFAEVAGYSRFGSYTGNGSADGPFVFCGFRPRFVLYKRTDAVANWVIWDTSRNTSNVVNNYLLPNSSGAEAALDSLDILSNGFKLRTSNADNNGSGGTFIFAAFAESPFKNSLAR